MAEYTPSRRNKLSLREIAVFGMLGAMMFASKILMEAFPNVHLIGVFIVAETVVFRKKALYPIYCFVFITGAVNGFNLWWIPYLYIWTVLWGMTMLLPKKMKPVVAVPVYAAVCSLHGFAYGTLYAPFQAIAFGLDLKGMLAWIVAGLPWDAVHGISNLIAGLILILPLVKIMDISMKAGR